ncbi:MAG: ATP cone domain-containing protein, partial [Candidatus Omnitrophota bacterium]
MRCPYCGNKNDSVIDSRASTNGSSVRRRRKCLKCRKRFTTYEYVERVPLMVVKKDGRREPFEREKLLNGIMVACEKR